MLRAVTRIDRFRETASFRGQFDVPQRCRFALFRTPAERQQPPPIRVYEKLPRAAHAGDLAERVRLYLDAFGIEDNQLTLAVLCVEQARFGVEADRQRVRSRAQAQARRPQIISR